MKKIWLMLLVSLLGIWGSPAYAAVNIESREMRPAEYIKIIYPVVSGMPDVRIQAKINTQIAAAAKGFAARFISYNGDVKLMAAEAHYRIRYNNSNILSITWDEYTMMERGAHPDTKLWGLNFDMQTGEQLVYQKLQPTTLEQFNTAVDKYLADKKIPHNIKFDKPGEVSANFYFDQNGKIVSIIQSGVITPRVLGILEFRVAE